MPILPWKLNLSLRREKSLTGTPGVLDALRERQWSPYPLLGGGSRQRIQEAFNTAQSANYAWMYSNSPAVRTVIDLIARNVGQLDLRLYEEITEAERQPRPDHPAALSLRYPSARVPSDQFVRALLKDFLINDNAYALMQQGPNQQIDFQWLPTGDVELVGSSLFEPDAYRYHRRDGTFIDFQPQQILHWRGENPHDPRLGFSHLETLRKVIAEDAALQQAIVELANSGMTESAWILRPLEAPEWSNEARGRFEEDLTNRIRRANKTPVVLEEGMVPQGMGVSPRDAEMLEVRKWALQRIATEYGVPLGLVGLDDDVEKAQKQFYADTLPPYTEQLTRTLNLQVLVQHYGLTEYCFEFNLDEKHMGDDRLKALTSATGRPVMLTNEARARLNLPAVDGGDDLVTPSNVIVGEKPSPQVMPIQNPLKPSQEGDHREEEPKALNGHKKQLEVSTEPRRQRDLARQGRYIDESKALFIRYYDRQADSLLKKGAKAVDNERWNRELAKDIHRQARSIVEREGGIYVSRLGGDDFDMSQVEHYLEAMAANAAKGINEATQQAIRQFGLENALNTARTERAEAAGTSIGARATIFAREEAAKQAPHFRAPDEDLGLEHEASC